MHMQIYKLIPEGESYLWTSGAVWATFSYAIYKEGRLEFEQTSFSGWFILTTHSFGVLIA